MSSQYNFEGDLLIPRTQYAAECTADTLPYAHEQLLETRPASTGPGVYQVRPPSFSQGALGSIQSRVANNPSPVCNMAALGATPVEPIRTEAYKRGSFSWVNLYPQGGPPMRITHEIFPSGNMPNMRGLGALGVAPAIAGSVVAGGAAIGALMALVQEYLQDDWQEEAVFRTHTTTIHNSMTTIQCLVGGASGESYGCTSPAYGGADGRDALDCICAAGTKPLCPLGPADLREWRLLRNEWSEFYKKSGSTGSSWTGGATEGEAAAAKIFARRMLTFYDKLVNSICPQDANTRNQLPDIAAGGGQALQQPVSDPPDDDAPAWLKWSVGGVVALTAFMGFKLLKDVFGD